MGAVRNVAILAFLAGAYASNPDEESFQRYLERQLTKEGSHWIESKVASHVASNIYPRNNYYLFSFIRIPEDRVTYVGLFGNWFRWPPACMRKIEPPKEGDLSKKNP